MLPSQIKKKDALKKRFKILYHLVLSLENDHLTNEMDELGNRLDIDDKLVESALNYYEDSVLSVFEDDVYKETI